MNSNTGYETLHSNSNLRLQSEFLEWSKKLPDATAVESVTTGSITSTDTFDVERCTYAELASWALQIVSTLKAQQIQYQDCVGLYTLPSLSWVVGILGILISDCVYVPIDPLLSEERNLQLLEYCAPLQILLVQKELWNDHSHTILRIVNRFQCGVLLLSSKVNDTIELVRSCTKRSTSESFVNQNQVNERVLAYVMFTTGTTHHHPTTVYVPHQCVLSNIASFKKLLFNFDTNESHHLRMAAVAPLGFDPSIIDVFLPLSVGGTVVIPSPEIKLKSELFASLMFKFHINALQCTPSFLRQFRYETLHNLLQSNVSPLQFLFLGGEPFPSVAEWRFWLPNQPTSLRIFNLYGITEVSVWALVEEVFPEQLRRKPLHYQVPLGLPLQDTEVVIDISSSLSNNESTHEFVVLNEILNERSRRKDLKRERFLVNFPTTTTSSSSSESWTLDPQSLSSKSKTTCLLQGRLYVGGPRRICFLNSLTENGQRWRDTGDDVRVVNGKIYFVGRSDFVVKIYGKRVNPLEVATALKSCPLFSDVVVLSYSSPQSNAPSKPLLIACVIPTDLTVTDRELILRARLYSRKHLPDYMRPDYYFIYSSFPTNLNGKVDMPRLLNEVKLKFETKKQSKSQYDQISKEMIAVYLKELWSTLLNIPKESDYTECYFVSLGGSSLDAYQCVEDIFHHYNLYNFELVDAQRRYLQNVLLHSKFSEVVDAIWKLCQLNQRDTHNEKTSLQEEPFKEKLQSSTVIRQTSQDQLQWLITDPVAIIQRRNLVTLIRSNNNQINCELAKQKLLTFDMDPNNKLQFQDLIQRNVEVRWKEFLGKCVDSSPLLVVNLLTDQNCVFIGSHSGAFKCITFENKRNVHTTVWTAILPDRIESSALLDHTGQFIVVGCYDHCVYVLSSVSGAVVWRFSTNDQVKCSPAQDPHTGLIWIGSHDGSVYALDIYQKTHYIPVRTSRPIFATPVFHPLHRHVYVASEDGKLYALRADGSGIVWSQQLMGPIFSSPAVDTQSDMVFVADVKHWIYAFSSLGSLVWKIQTSGPIFSSLLPFEFSQQSSTSSGEKVLLFGCHDNHFYCLNQLNGNLKWKINLGSTIFSSPSALYIREISKNSLHSVISVCASKGELYLLSENGTILNQIELAGEVFSSPVNLVLNRTLYWFVGCRDDHLYCFVCLDEQEDKSK